jgi:hypothetical protein
VKIKHCAPPARTQSRAAGVSPPWLCKRRLQRQSGEFGRFEYACGGYSTGGLRPPLLCSCANVCRRKTNFSMHKRTPKKSGGRQPAVGVSNAVAMAHAFVQRHEREPAVVLVGRACRMVWEESPASAFLEPRGAYAPRSWLHVRMPLQMGDFRRRERYGGVAAASAFVHWVEDGQFSPDQSDAFRAAGLRPRSECTVRGRCKGNVSGAPFPFTPAVNVSSMRLGNAFRQRRMLI